MKDMTNFIAEIFKNLFLISVSKKMDYKKLVAETNEEIRFLIDYDDDEDPLKDFKGLIFIETLAGKMGSTLGEAYNFSQRQKEIVLQSLLEQIDPISKAYEIDFYTYENDCTEFQGKVSFMDSSNQKKLRQYFNNRLIEKNDEAINIEVSYHVTFTRTLLEDEPDKVAYSVILDDWRDMNNSDFSEYLFESYTTLWKGNKGGIADFIEKAYSHYMENQVEDDGNAKPAESKDLTDEIFLSIVLNNGKENSRNDASENELLTYIGNDTRTIDLMDKFEGRNSLGRPYDRIVIENCSYYKDVNGKRVGFNLVIERGGWKCDYTGGTTFTSFKKGEALGLAKHIVSQFTDDIIEHYLDTDQFYRFPKPYLLRAQNSSNRTGYGWQWDWSGGIGNYTEGTQYGETTNYCFAGAYVTSRYWYNPVSRNAYKKLSDLTDIPSTDIWIAPLKVYKNQIDEIVASESAINTYLVVKSTKSEKMVPVVYNKNEQSFYIAESEWEKHKDDILSDDYKIELG